MSIVAGEIYFHDHSRYIEVNNNKRNHGFPWFFLIFLEISAWIFHIVIVAVERINVCSFHDKLLIIVVCFSYKMDFEPLHKEVAAAVEADKKYQRENDAKFRAVEQRVESYDEFEWVWIEKSAFEVIDFVFRAIVKGCHLRPLDKKEHIAGLSRSIPSWNAVGSSRKYSLESEVGKYFPSVRNERREASNLEGDKQKRSG